MQTLTEEITKSVRCIRANYDIDSLVFSFILSKRAQVPLAVSFSKDSDCELILARNREGNSLAFNKTTYYIGRTSFTSILEPAKDDIVPYAVAILFSLVYERRGPSELEAKRVEALKGFGLESENGPKLLGYHELPLFTSLTITIDPYIPEVSGNRNGAEGVLKELKIDLTSKFDELSDAQRNSLLYRIAVSMQRFNPNVTSSDIIAERYFVDGMDLLELTYASMLALDLIGASAIYEFIANPSFSRALISLYREEMGKGFSLGEVSEKGNAIYVSTNLKSPLLVRQILVQGGKLKGDKTVIIKNGDRAYTSRFFMDSDKEGLIRV